ncbi:MAG: hypothetical protein DSY57_02880 [Desulfobulbus sp.]|nr:MAG: hypothetical protein DSY57_02880 [Desulfobulbus sp.]
MKGSDLEIFPILTGSPAMENHKLPIHTRLGIYATGAILGILSIFMLKTCVSAVYYGKKTTSKEISDSYTAGFTSGLTGDGSIKQSKNLSNPLLLKVYRKGFRDGRDSKDRGKQ